jgi:NADH-quinone oxidoreductase subunit J
VAALYVTLRAPFLAVIQVMVYAGGIVVLYLFVVMLVNLKRPPEAHSDPRRQGRLGFVMAVAVLAELVAIFAVGWAKPATAAGALSPNNVEQIGRALYTDYLIPFELASILLLVAMIGAIILAKREL